MEKHQIVNVAAEWKCPSGRANNGLAATKNPVLSTSWRTKENGAQSDKHFGGASNA